MGDRLGGFIVFLFLAVSSFMSYRLKTISVSVSELTAHSKINFVLFKFLQRYKQATRTSTKTHTQFMHLMHALK